MELPGQLTYNGIPLNQIEYIAKGGYGYVFKYASESRLREGWRKVYSHSHGYFYYWNENERKSQWEIPRQPGSPYYEVAVKTFNNEKDEEIKIVNYLNDNGKRGTCNLINSIIISMMDRNYKQKQVCVMDLMDGDMDELVILPAKEKTPFIKNIVDNLVCISEFGPRQYCYYTDLKLGNIVFKRTSEGIKLVLGDIGSLCFGPSDSGSSTFPSPESYIPRRTYLNCNESSTVWSFGVILLHLFGSKWNNLFYWKKMRNYKDLNIFFDESTQFVIKEIQDKKLDQLKIDGVEVTVGELLERMLDPNPERRIKLTEIQDLVTSM